jgi:hypothetical protein
VQRDFVEGSHELAALKGAGDADLHADEAGGYDLSQQLISRSFTQFPGLVNKGTKGNGLSTDS